MFPRARSIAIARTRTQLLPHHAAHGLLSLISLIRAFSLNVIKRNQASTTKKNHIIYNELESGVRVSFSYVTIVTRLGQWQWAVTPVPCDGEFDR